MKKQGWSVGLRKQEVVVSLYIIIERRGGLILSTDNLKRDIFTVALDKEEEYERHVRCHLPTTNEKDSLIKRAVFVCKVYHAHDREYVSERSSKCYVHTRLNPDELSDQSWLSYVKVLHYRASKEEERKTHSSIKRYLTTV
jgi:hypothetical protein